MNNKVNKIVCILERKRNLISHIENIHFMSTEHIPIIVRYVPLRLYNQMSLVSRRTVNKEISDHTGKSKQVIKVTEDFIERYREGVRLKYWTYNM